METSPCALLHGPKLPDDFNKDNAGPLDYFSLFIPEDIYERLARETNAYAKLCQQDKGERDSAWTETSGEKIRAYLGLNIVMGASPRNQYEGYCKDDDLSGLCSIQSCDVAEQVCETYLVFTSQLCGLQTTQGPPLNTIPSKE